ncbi:hypothetical protein [Agrobacterium larrymoorei]|uniref:hypothetical protein n=1 Tax=Agrobacterium larrymoorei TaxID=160699 RepID=UPI0030BCAC59
MFRSRLVLLAAAIFAMMVHASTGLTQENVDSDRSPVGYKGLEIWLQSWAIPVTRETSPTTSSVSNISLRIVPLSWQQAEEMIGDSANNRDLKSALFGNEPKTTPTLIVLPKWRADRLTNGVADEASLVGSSDVNEILPRLGLFNLHTKIMEPRFRQAQQSILPQHVEKIRLFRAQVFVRDQVPPNCMQMASLQAGPVLLKCTSDFVFYVLSDPDLLNNHGLALGENAAFAVSMINELRGPYFKGPVYLAETGMQIAPASNSGRFLAFHLWFIWGAIILVAAVCFWRGAVRFGKPLTTEATSDLSKAAATEATARLLRLSGNDGRMTAQFVHNLLADKAGLLFGPHAANDAGIERMFRHLSLRDKPSAEAFEAISRELMNRGKSMTQPDLRRHLETFKKRLGSIKLESR